MPICNFIFHNGSQLSPRILISISRRQKKKNLADSELLSLHWFETPSPLFRTLPSPNPVCPSGGPGGGGRHGLLRACPGVLGGSLSRGHPLGLTTPAGTTLAPVSSAAKFALSVGLLTP